MNDKPIESEDLKTKGNLKKSFPADARDAMLKPMDPNKSPEENYMDWVTSPSDSQDIFIP